jgi:alpha-glucosidase
MTEPLWWQRGVIYQIYPRSFQDSNGDGVGDIPGIISRLDYVADLGVDAIWLSPHYPSPQEDFGYDVADYTGVDPMYGTLDDFDRLVAEAHQRHLKVIVDFVPNHSSSQHPWFIESASSTDNPKRDWYVWRDPKHDGSVPNNWVSVFGGPGWEMDDTTGQFYLHSFLASQPDLNWRNPEVEREMIDVLRFWMDRGVDGFRIDVAQKCMKDPLLRDNPPAAAIDPSAYKFNPEWAATDHIYDVADPDIHLLFRKFRAALDEYPERFSIAEIHEWDWERWASYYGDGHGLHMPFNFAPLTAGVDPDRLRGIITDMEGALPPGAWPNWVLGNHDERRIATRLGREESAAMAVLLLTLRGTPTIYYGDEIGMVETEIPPELQQDPYGRRVPGQGRDGCRTPMQWSPATHAGFSSPDTASTWLPVHPDHTVQNVETELEDTASRLGLYRRLLQVRRANPALHSGSVEVLPSESSVVAFRRSYQGADSFVIAANLSDGATDHSIDGQVTVGTDPRKEGAAFDGQLAPWESVVVKTSNLEPHTTNR